MQGLPQRIQPSAVLYGFRPAVRRQLDSAQGGRSDTPLFSLPGVAVHIRTIPLSGDTELSTVGASAWQAAKGTGLHSEQSAVPPSGCPPGWARVG